MELSYDNERGYEVGVYLCLGLSIHDVNPKKARDFSEFNSFEKINDLLSNEGKLFIFLGDGIHKIKKKAEQLACKKVIDLLDSS